MVMGLPAELILRGTAAMVCTAAYCTIKPSCLRTVLAAGGRVTSCGATCVKAELPDAHATAGPQNAVAAGKPSIEDGHVGRTDHDQEICQPASV